LKGTNKPFLDVLREQGKFELFKDKTAPSLKASYIAPDDTQIFVLSPEVSLAAHKLIRTPSFNPQPIEELRFPYPNMAIELPLSMEVKNIRTPDDPMGGVFPISRVGALIQQSDDFKLVLVTPYWEFADHLLVQLPMFSFIFTNEVPHVPPMLDLVINKKMVRTTVVPSRTFLSTIEGVGLDTMKFLKHMYTLPETAKHIKEAASELSTILFACSTLLNCKSGVRQAKIPARTAPKGIKLGARKQKQMTSSSYTLLHLDEIEQVAPDGTISHKADIAAHYVRGHFKQRSKGIYWWNPFIRGKGELKRREAYIVKE
jgi:hypothetical protein